MRQGTLSALYLGARLDNDAKRLVAASWDFVPCELDARVREVVARHPGGLGIDRVAKIMGCSRQEAARVERAAIAKLARLQAAADLRDLLQDEPLEQMEVPSERRAESDEP